MGEGATMAPNVSLRNGERIVIGARTKVGERAYLWAGDSERRDPRSARTAGSGPRSSSPPPTTACARTSPSPYQERNERDVTIGNDVWLGARVFIGAGVTLGDGCVVSAGSVVTRSLPPASVAVGVPARIVRRREDYGDRDGERRPAAAGTCARAARPPLRSRRRPSDRDDRRRPTTPNRALPTSRS